MTFQSKVQEWLLFCFGRAIATDKVERGDRLLEETLELLQSCDYPPERARALINYVYNRPTGEPAQETGGVMVCLAAYCTAHGLDMETAGEIELARCWDKTDKIRAKHAGKPTGDRLISDQPAPHGWIVWNDGPGAWFLVGTYDKTMHELSDDVRPATHIEQWFMSRNNNRLGPVMDDGDQ